MIARFLLLIVSAMMICGIGCVSQQTKNSLLLGGRCKVQFCTVAAAAAAVTTDTTDGYFEKVQAVELSIQMKKPLKLLSANRDSMLMTYRKYLVQDLNEFSQGEKAAVEKVFKEIYTTCERVAPGLFPKQIKLIKTQGQYYGKSVYYTRENCIIIPANGLHQRDMSDFKRTMYHEIWHILSRNHPDLQKEAYALIGFSPIDMQKVRISDTLSRQIIYNPDGIDIAWQMSLKGSDSTTKTCIPILHTVDTDGYVRGKDEFFNYIAFSLYEVRDNQVITKADGVKSVVDLQQEPDFFAQVTQNTDYIIHPDELIADNFMYVMTTSHDKLSRQDFTPEGNVLLAKLEKLLITYVK
jgi:hypothetical protein